VYASESAANSRPGAFSRLNNSIADKFFLGDFNRDRNSTNSPFPVLTNGTANNVGYRVANPNSDTFNARGSGQSSKLDYLIKTGVNFNPSERRAQLPDGIVLNQLPNANTISFPSDHFPVVFDDGKQSFSALRGEEVKVEAEAAAAALAKAVEKAEAARRQTDELDFYTFNSVDPANIDVVVDGSNVQLGTGRLPTDIVGTVQSSNYNQTYYLDGTLTLTPYSNKDYATNQNGPRYQYQLPGGKKPENIVGIDYLSNSYQNITYYDDGTGSIGGGSRNQSILNFVPIIGILNPPDPNKDFNLGSNRTFEYTLPNGKTPKDIQEVAIDKNEHVFAFYKDGTFSEGTINDLDAYKSLQRFTSSDYGPLIAGASINPSGKLGLFKLT
jgi:hypothetical protein